MTVATTNITSGPYTGTGSGSTFSYDFRVDDKTQLSVWETTDAGVKTLLTVDSDYTVAGVGVDGGGIITRLAGNLPTDYIWYIRSNYADTQSTAFASQGGFLPSVHEAALDKRTFVSQQQQDLFRRAIKLDDSDESVETVDLTIPIVATRASQYLGFDASGNLITIAGTSGVVTVSSFMETLLDDNDIETALATLGLGKGADVASAGTLALGVGDYFDITGTTTVTNIGTKFIGAQATLQFDGILTFTHHATDLILPGGANITTAAGDHAFMVEYDTGKWRCVSYIRASSLPMILDTAQTVTGDKTFIDNAFSIADDGDNTKKIVFNGSAITTGNTRTLNMPDKDLNFDFGDYTPSLTGVVNIADVGAPFGGRYTRIGNIVNVSVQVTGLLPTAGSTISQFRITLPIASNLASGSDATGAASFGATGGATSYRVGLVYADGANDEVSLDFYSLNTSSHSLYINFMYKII